MKHFLLTLFFAPLIGFGQNILYLGGKAHLGNGEFINVSAISVNNGKGYRALSNISEHGGQEVPHLHFHLFGGEKVGKMVE